MSDASKFPRLVDEIADVSHEELAERARAMVDALLALGRRTGPASWDDVILTTNFYTIFNMVAYPAVDRVWAAFVSSFTSASGGALYDDDFRVLLAYAVDHNLPLPFAVRHELSRSLLALNEGEVRSFLKRVRRGRKSLGWTATAYRFTAFWHVYRLHGMGQTITNARRQVALAYGHCQDNEEAAADIVRRWEQRELKGYYGDLLGRAKQQAIDIGRAALETPPYATIADQLHLMAIASALDDFDLARCAENYQKALRRERVPLPPWPLA